MSRGYFRNWKAFLVVVLSVCTTINLNIRNKLKKKKRERGFYRHPPPSSYTVIDFSNFLKAVSNSIQTEEILLKCDISFRDVYFKLISLKSIPCIAICSHRYWILHDNKRKTKWRMENQSPSNLKKQHIYYFYITFEFIIFLLWQLGWKFKNWYNNWT